MNKLYWFTLVFILGVSCKTIVRELAGNYDFQNVKPMALEYQCPDVIQYERDEADRQLRMFKEQGIIK